MKLSTWINERGQSGTAAEIARRMLVNGCGYRDLDRRLAMETRIRRLFVLEAVLQNGGDQKKTALALGVTRETINRAMRALGISSTDLKGLVERVGK